MIWTLVALLLVLWLLGLLAHVGGDLVHLILVVAVLFVLYQLFFNRQPR
jgi:uncharacterized protein DUF5670